MGARVSNYAQVWKFSVPVSDEFELEMPRHAEILFIAVQDDSPFIWARVVPGRHKETRKFKLRGTGHPIDTVSTHLGSFMLRGGALVFHLFEAADL